MPNTNATFSVYVFTNRKSDMEEKITSNSDFSKLFYLNSGKTNKFKEE